MHNQNQQNITKKKYSPGDIGILIRNTIHKWLSADVFNSPLIVNVLSGLSIMVMIANSILAAKVFAPTGSIIWIWSIAFFAITISALTAFSIWVFLSAVREKLVGMTIMMGVLLIFLSVWEIIASSLVIHNLLDKRISDGVTNVAESNIDRGRIETAKGQKASIDKWQSSQIASIYVKLATYLDEHPIDMSVEQGKVRVPISKIQWKTHCSPAAMVANPNHPITSQEKCREVARVISSNMATILSQAEAKRTKMDNYMLGIVHNIRDINSSGNTTIQSPFFNALKSSVTDMDELTNLEMVEVLWSCALYVAIIVIFLIKVYGNNGEGAFKFGHHVKKERSEDSISFLLGGIVTAIIRGVSNRVSHWADNPPSGHNDMEEYKKRNPSAHDNRTASRGMGDMGGDASHNQR